ncbi:helix-turn-helix domain-containing protein [Kineococcus sp. SYSU DK002]|uniref:helix-turn-helix domain-containing protein n=1 Tax=Kineococcus sp. SYSU DK002 TaxID=3383123 RepID=UPI003D7D4CF7
MCPSFVPPRQVTIGDAASFVGTTPRAIRHYHQIGLLPEPVRGGDGRRRYGYGEVVRLLWIRRMADAGIALDDIRVAFAGAAPTGEAPGGDHDVEGVLERLEATLAAQEAELQRQRAAVHRMRTRGSRVGLLSDVVAGRLEGLPEGSLRPSDLDTLLVTERIFGPLGAAVQATRFTALATHPGLREEGDRVDAAEEALDDAVAVDDPRVAQVAARRHAFESALHAVIEGSGLAREDEALLDAWDDTPAAPATPDRGRRPTSAADAVAKVPHDFSPARLRCLELAEELAARD